MKTFKMLFLLVICFTISTQAQGGKAYGIFAPADAYENNSEFPFYGSENEWSRRMFTEERGNTQYKRRGQRQMLAIIEGQPEEAVKYCLKRLLVKPIDPENYYMLSVAYSVLNQPDSSYNYFSKAIDSDIPYERFLAGPKTLLKNLYNSNGFKNYYSQNPQQLVHGPMLGTVTSTSAKFWIRTFEESEFYVKAFALNNSSIPKISKTFKTSKNVDYTGIAELNNLLPNEKYSFEVIIKDSKEKSYKGKFQTYPENNSSKKFSLAFGGGAGFTPMYEHMWSTINEHELSALLLLGDNVYIDLPQMPNEFHDFTYYRRQSNNEFRQLTSSVPVYAIWDDHDAAMDDIWLGPYKDKPAWKMPTLELFKNNWVNPSYGSEESPACWFNFNIGDVEFFMLDGRFYRTCPFDTTNRSMLGPEQKEWLLTSLQKSDAKIKVIVSPVPWDFRAKPGSHDTWGGFPEERNQIFDFIENEKIDGVILMAADRHRTDAWEIERENSYNLFEFQSSRLTNMHTHELMPEAIIAYNEKCSFGHITFDTEKEVPEITFKIINIDNVVIDSVKVTYDKISFD